MKREEKKQAVLQRDGHRCAICGRTDVPLYFDHIKPASQGGSDDISNLRLVCPNCNAIYSKTITSALSGSAGAALIGGAVGGPVGALLGAATGAAVGYFASGVHPDVR